MIDPDARQVDWEARTTGEAIYTADMPIEGLLYAQVIRSPHAHARIISIDTESAKREPGVVAVLTAADFTDRRYQDYGAADRLPLASDTVRHVGHEVAVVAAESAAQAKRALDLIRIRYRVLPAAVNLRAALHPRAPLVHPSGPDGNIQKRMVRRFGNPDLGRQSARFRHRAQYVYGIQAHACMEPQSVLARWDATSAILHLWCPTQSARNVQRELAHMLALRLDQVRLHRVGIGGDFGSRVRASDTEVLVAALAMRTRRPVRLTLDRQEEFAHTKHRHDFAIELETGVDSSRVVTYREAKVIVENGAFAHAGPNELNYCTILLGSQNRLIGAEIEGLAVYTHRRAGGSCRGAGGPQAAFAMESQLDEIATELGMDPIELRKLNANLPGQKTITGWEVGSAAMIECLEEVRRRLNWDEARRSGGGGRGVGVAAAIHVSGAIVTPYTSRAEAAVEIAENGRIRLFSGCSDPGTGQATVIARLCAHELGVRAHEICVETMDTATTPYDPGAGASRGTTITGNAVLKVARLAATALRKAASVRLNCESDDILLEGGFARRGGQSVPFGELAAALPEANAGVARFEAEAVADIPITVGESGFGNLAPSYGFAAHGVEVEVDRDTGQVRVLRVVAVHDSGTIINPVGARGQVIGGVVMSLGAALGEELIYDEGRVVNANYGDYAMLRAADCPPIEVVFVGGASPLGPLGAKGLAEIALMPTAAAVANAVAHATGVRIRNLPLTPDKVLNALRSADGRRPDWKLWRRPERWWIAATRWAYPRGLRAALDRWGTRMARRPLSTADIESLVRPSSLAEAVRALSTRDHARPVGGGTDLLVARQQGISASRHLVDLTGCRDLTILEEQADGSLRLGGALTLTDLIDRLAGSELAGDRVIAATAQTVASEQIRHAATLAGNLCQANRCWFYRSGLMCYKRGGFTCPCYAVTGDHRFYHAVVDAHRCQSVTPSDLASTLTALEAHATVAGPRGERRVPIADLYVGPGETVVGKDEIISSITVPHAARRRLAAFEKLKLAEGGFAVVSVCVSLCLGTRGQIAECAVVFGGVANTPYRSREVEAMLVGVVPDHAIVQLASTAWTARAHPLSDNGWKVDAASGLLRRALSKLLLSGLEFTSSA